MSHYTEELAHAICLRVADGESLRSVCRDESMPAMSTVFKWLNEHKSFAEQYARAKEAAADAMAEDIQDIADEAPQMTTNKAGALVVDNGFETFRKTRIDTRKWIASKLKPKKYGEKIDAKVEHSGSITVAAAPTDPEL